MTVERVGPTSAIRAKKTRNATAVQTTASPTTAEHDVAGRPRGRRLGDADRQVGQRGDRERGGDDAQPRQVRQPPGQDQRADGVADGDDGERDDGARRHRRRPRSRPAPRRRRSRPAGRPAGRPVEPVVGAGDHGQHGPDQRDGGDEQPGQRAGQPLLGDPEQEPRERRSRPRRRPAAGARRAAPRGAGRGRAPPAAAAPPRARSGPAPACSGRDSSTATLMSRYGMPQITPIAAKRTQPRLLMSLPPGCRSLTGVSVPHAPDSPRRAEEMLPRQLHDHRSASRPSGDHAALPVRGAGGRGRRRAVCSSSQPEPAGRSPSARTLAGPTPRCTPVAPVGGEQREQRRSAVGRDLDPARAGAGRRAGARVPGDDLVGATGGWCTRWASRWSGDQVAGASRRVRGPAVAAPATTAARRPPRRGGCRGCRGRSRPRRRRPRSPGVLRLDRQERPGPQVAEEVGVRVAAGGVRAVSGRCGGRRRTPRRRPRPGRPHGRSGHSTLRRPGRASRPTSPSSRCSPPATTRRPATTTSVTSAAVAAKTTRSRASVSRRRRCAPSRAGPRPGRPRHRCRAPRRRGGRARVPGPGGGVEPARRPTSARAAARRAARRARPRAPPRTGRPPRGCRAEGHRRPGLAHPAGRSDAVGQVALGRGAHAHRGAASRRAARCRRRSGGSRARPCCGPSTPWSCSSRVGVTP